jgi:peptidyl-prolyl cis-trans isomerase SurA
MRGGWKVLFAAALCLLIWADIAISDVIDRTVAVVNGEIILYSELQEQIKLMQKVVPEAKTDDPAKKAAIERDVLKQLIRQKLTEAEVKRLDIKISDREVDDSISEMKRESRLSDAQFEMQMKESGQTMARFRDGVKKELARNRLLERTLRSKTVISEQQVDAYLKESGRIESAGTVVTEKVQIGVILIPADASGGGDADKTARDILAQLKGGADFRQLAKQYSKGPAAQEGGDIGYISADELAPPLANAIKGLKKGDVSDLVRGQGGYYILKLFESMKEKQSKTDPALRQKVRQQLYQQELNRKFEEWVRDLESKAFIQISL